MTNTYLSHIQLIVLELYVSRILNHERKDKHPKEGVFPHSRRLNEKILYSERFWHNNKI